MPGGRDGVAKKREAPITMTEPGPTAPGSTAPGPTATGFVFADVPNRAIAFIIDAILLGIIGLVVAGILGGLGLSAGSFNPDLTFNVNPVGVLVQGIINLAISAVYFIYTWTSMRATIGMRALGMQIGNAGDGGTLTTEQAVRRFLAIWGPNVLAQVLQPIPVVGWIFGLLALVWIIYLIYTTAKSPTKQGWHDVFANTQVVKAAKTV
jgi:uncharacterized RDD family membrane protein YckC